MQQQYCTALHIRHGHGHETRDIADDAGKGTASGMEACKDEEPKEPKKQYRGCILNDCQEVLQKYRLETNLMPRGLMSSHKTEY